MTHYPHSMSLAFEAQLLPLTMDENKVIRVGKTRVTLDTIVSSWAQGATPEQIADSYDVLELADIYSVIAWYLWKKEEVDQHLEEKRNEAATEKRSMTLPSQSGIRERLINRLSSKD